MKTRKNAGPTACTHPPTCQVSGGDLSALVEHMNHYVLTIVVADLARADGAHRQYNADEIIGLALFLHDTLPANMTRPAVPRAAGILAVRA